MLLKDKNIIVTGATGGIGRELAHELDNEGSKLILISESESELQNLMESLKGEGNVYFVCDFSDQTATQKLAKEIAKKYKKIDILVNSAGIGVYKEIKDATLENWNDSLNINVTSAFILIKELIKPLRKSGSLVLNIGSGAGVIPMGGRSLYSTSKFALRGLTLSLAKEFKNTNIDFCLITLGSVLTSFGPMTLEAKKKEMESGKAYFTPDWVAKKLIEIMKDTDRDIEYTLFPSGYEASWEKSS
jgi:short-subunit dehydrogenase